MFDKFSGFFTQVCFDNEINVSFILYNLLYSLVVCRCYDLAAVVTMGSYLEIKNEAKGNSQLFEMTFKFLVFSLQNHNN